MPESDRTAEVESIWEHKPWWCQPWSILLSGTVAIALSWIGLHQWWLTALVGTGVLAWWTLFLVLVPKAWRTEEEQRRQGQ